MGGDGSSIATKENRAEQEAVLRGLLAEQEIDFVVLGRDVERQVLSRAVKLQAEDRILLIGHRAVVFH